MSTSMPEGRPHALLSTRETRRFLSDYVRKRVGDQDVDDVVQTVLVDALASTRIPEVEGDVRRWLIGIARHKIADLHRKAGREQPTELPDLEASAPPIEERHMTTWAERQAPTSKEAARTLEWMAREGEGEKLEQIALDEQVAAATVRQRVSRMRRWMRERWLAELAAVAALGLLAFAVWRWLSNPPPPVTREPGPTIEQPSPKDDVPAPKLAPSPVERARDLRRAAGEECGRSAWEPCLQKLDEARELDPAGDRAPDVQDMRAGANRALEESKQKGVPEPKGKGDGSGVAPEGTQEQIQKAPSKPPPPTKGTTPVKPTGKTSTFDGEDAKRRKAQSDGPLPQDGSDSEIVLAPSGSSPSGSAPPLQANTAPQQAAFPPPMKKGGK